MADRSSPPSPPVSSRTPETVLVVEPEVLARMLISSYLRECGYKVIEATNGDEAILVLKEPDVPVDIIFSVVEMPGTADGFGLSTWTRANHPNIQVILASNVTREAKAAGELCEDGPMMKKPYDHQLLADRIRRLLAGRNGSPS